MLKKALLILVLGMVLAACGDTAATTTAPDTTEPAPVTTADVPTTTAGSTETTVEPTDDSPIVIGTLTSLTGNFTPWGVSVRDGMQLAVDEINAAGGIDGRMLELVVADDQSVPEEGVAALERLIEQDGAVAVGGVISSGVAVNAATVAEELQVPLFLIKAGSGAILTQDSRYTFRTCLPAAPMVAGPILQYAQNQGLSRIGAIIADYEWGQAISAALTDTFAAAEGIELQVEVAPVPETDFTTYLRALESLDPEMIVATGHPPGSGAITVQSADLGFDIPITGAYTPRSLIMGAAADAAVQRYADFGCADYFSDSYQELAPRYLEASDNPFMEDDAVAGFGIVTMLADAFANVGDDPVAVAEYLHGQTYDLPGYAFQMGWTEWGELATAQPLFTLTTAEGAPEGINEAGEWWFEELIRPEPLEPFVP